MSVGEPGKPILESDLHAMVDEQLETARSSEVEAWLATHPEEAARVAEWRAQKERLRSMFDPVMAETVPQRLLDLLVSQPWPRWLPLSAAAAALLVVGIATGWLARGLIDAPFGRSLAQLPERAAIAHRVFTVEVRHPVEVAAAEQEHLVAWLTKRMGQNVAAPDLSQLGYKLVGGRLLAGRSGPACQLMYEDRSGKRITVYVAENPANEQTAFRFREDGALSTFYWLDGSLGYALSGELRREELLSIAELLYKKLRF